MKSIAIIDYDISVIGGVEKVAEKLANSLASYYKVHVISLNKTNKETPYNFTNNIEIKYFVTSNNNRIRSTIKNTKLLGKYLKENNIEVALCMGHYATLVSIINKKFSKTKLVFCDHGALINQWDDKSIRYMRKFNSIFSQYIVTLTDSSKKDYIKLFHTKNNKITRIYNCIPNELINDYRNVKYDNNSNKILTVGRLSNEKGLDMLVDIATELKKLNSNWSWDIYGDGELKKEIAKRIKENNLEKFVFLKGNNNNVINEYKNYSIYALTSYREGLPLVLLEAKVNKLPIVSFDIETGPNEIIENNVNGYLVEKFDIKKFANRLNELLTNKKTRKEFSDNSYKDIEKFSEDIIIKEWKNLINKLLKEK